MSLKQIALIKYPNVFNKINRQPTFNKLILVHIKSNTLNAA